MRGYKRSQLLKPRTVALSAGLSLLVALMGGWNLKSLSQSPPLVPVPALPKVKEGQTLPPSPPAPTPSPSAEPTEPQEPAEIEGEGEPKPEVVKPPGNPLKRPGDSLEQLIQERMSEDMWRSMRSPLPCLEFEPQCVSTLQTSAIATSPLLREIDKRSQEIQEKIEEARVANQSQINLSVFTPAVQFLLKNETQTVPGQQPREIGFIERIGMLLAGSTGIINGLLSAVGVPLIQAVSGGNTETQRNSIAIADLQVKHAQMQRDRAELSDKVREAIAVAVLDFDTKAREFQISQEIAIRENQRFQLTQVSYRFGQGTTDNYLASESQLDGKKAQVFRAWSGMRSQLERIKLLVLGVKTEE